MDLSKLPEKVRQRATEMINKGFPMQILKHDKTLASGRVDYRYRIVLRKIGDVWIPVDVLHHNAYTKKYLRGGAR